MAFGIGHTSEMTNADERYERLKREFDEFLLYLPDGFLEGDLATRMLTRMNRSACLLLGFDPEAPPVPISGPEVLAEGEFDRINEYNVRLIRTSIEQGVPYRRVDHQEILEVRMKRVDGTEFPAEFQGSYVLNEAGIPYAIRFLFRDISERKAMEEERAARIAQLEQLLPICAWCNRIRDDEGEWRQIEAYIHEHAGYDFTHSICADCEKRFGLGPA